MSTLFDVVIVGSGPSGAMAASTLVEQGFKVLLLDAGADDHVSRAAVPDKSFSEIRKTESNQSSFFLGAMMEGIPEAGIRVGSQLTPPRQFVSRNSETILPYQSRNFFPMQSVSLGGLGAAWGAACYTFRTDELRKMGIYEDNFGEFYDAVASEIGISGDANSDNKYECLSGVSNLQPPLDIDTNGNSILKRYAVIKDRLRPSGTFSMSSSTLASLSQDKGTRKQNPYHDMEFWSDMRQSVYRPRYTIKRLEESQDFVYQPGVVVIRFEETISKFVRVFGTSMTDGGACVFEGRKLILCAGAINSSRIALNSLELSNIKTPILCNPYTYLACVNLHMFGKTASDRRHSLAQLFGIYHPVEDWSDSISLQFYSYRSLLLFKLIKEMPLPVWAGLLISRLLLNCLTIIGIHHSDSPEFEGKNPVNWLQIKTVEKCTVPTVEMSYTPTTVRVKKIDQRESSIAKILFKLRCIAIGKIQPGNASSIHYAGTIPINQGESFGCNVQGKLNQTNSVFVGDSSSWRYLPAKGLTFTVMANGRRIATHVASSLR